MGPFIQGRMVLPFWLERTESLFLSSCRRQTAAGPSGESLNYIYTVSLSQEMARKVFIFTLHWKPTKRNVDLKVFKFHPSKTNSIHFSCRKLTPTSTKDLCPVELRNMYLYLCHFIKYYLVTVLMTLILYLFIFSATFVLPILSSSWLLGSILLTAEWMHSQQSVSWLCLSLFHVTFPNRAPYSRKK